MAEKTAVEVWSEAMEAVERILGQTDILLRQTTAESLNDGVLSVLVPNIFTKDYIEGEHLKQIHNALQKITGTGTEVKFVIQADDWTDQASQQEKKYPQEISPMFSL